MKAEQGVRVKEEAGFPAEDAGVGVVPMEIQGVLLLSSQMQPRM